MEFKTFFESFETTQDFLLNKDYSDKTFSELLKDFEKSGGKLIGQGKYGQVFSHPQWNYVLKTFIDDQCYLSFCRFAYKNPHPAFPKFYGPPKRIVPQYLRTNPKLYYVRIEKLFPITDLEYLKEIVKHLSFNSSRKYDPNYIQQQKELEKQYTQQKSLPRNQRNINYHDIDHFAIQYNDFHVKHPEVVSLVEGYHILLTHGFKCALDIHEGNIMKRQSGELVLIDPLWYGTNPYMDAMLAMRRETDSWGDEEMDYKLIKGGKLPKPEKLPKKKPVQPFYQSQYDDPPF
jgi:hypothetical protein